MAVKSSTAIPAMRDAATRNWLLNHPAFAESAYGKSLKSQPLGFIDIGARGGVSEVVEPIAGATAVLGFEPNESEAQALRAAHAASPVYQSFEVRCAAVAGTTGSRDFYETARGVNSSLLRPSESFASRYQVPGFAVENIASCQTDTLDNIIYETDESAAPYGEFLKLDVQGAELEVLQGAERVLSERTVAVIAEVSFCELYENQPLFGDVASFLKSKGFGFYGFHAMSHRASHLRHLIDHPSPQWSQRLIHADGIFFRENILADSVAVEGSRSGAALFIAAVLLGHYDIASELLACGRAPEDCSQTALSGLLEELACHPPKA